mgnify:CR=1 FL=1
MKLLLNRPEPVKSKFPATRLSPISTVLPISPTFADYAEKVTEKLKAAGVRAELDARNEKIGYRIREAQLSKVPYMIVVGANEEEAGNISVRARGEGPRHYGDRCFCGSRRRRGTHLQVITAMMKKCRADSSLHGIFLCVSADFTVIFRFSFFIP